jgi:eukaryotic-like serine/threonine-protein kinase
MTDNQTALTPGTLLGPYRILGPIGAGGMGEVYRALDTRLNRVIAIKLLGRSWAENAEMRQRFEREAQIIASLNHPNICVLHDIGNQDGTDFLVMEYLEGEALSARLARKPMDVDEALQTAIAIADALDKAHRRGVVHRDLKPSNIMLTATGPKLLDFGLAKREAGISGSGANQPATSGASTISGPSSSQAKTQSDITSPGAILGTLQYMAPEQLEGMDADARTDIFAFGAVLHEMLTGKKAFEGTSRILLISAIATAEPEPVSRVQAAAPPALDHVVKTCMAKRPLDRWQTARDLRSELKWISEASVSGAGEGLVLAASPSRRQPLPWILLAITIILVVAIAVPASIFLGGGKPAEEFRFHNTVINPTIFSISPDGRLVAFVDYTGSSLCVCPIGSVTSKTLFTGDRGSLGSFRFYHRPFWSPDSKFIVFAMGGKWKRIEAAGGAAQDICDLADFYGVEGTWNREGSILFGSDAGLLRVSAEGGKPEPITTPAPGESGHYFPHFVPDGRHYLYTAWNKESAKSAIMAGTLGSKQRTRIMAAGSNAVYSEPGFLIFNREDTLYAQPFNWKKLAVSGEPTRIADNVYNDPPNDWSHFTASLNGVLAFYRNGAPRPAVRPAVYFTAYQLVWADRTGKVLESPGPPGAYWGVEVAPDGKRIAVHLHDESGGDIIVIEPRGSTTRLTFDASRHNSSPVWLPNGDRIVYCSLQKGKWGIYQTLSKGSGMEELLYESELPKAPMSWSPDGKRIVFWVEDPRNKGDLWILTLEDKKAAPLIASQPNETHAQISADGKWIAYTSDSTGRPEVYVRPFPSGSGLYQISFHGGDWPRWRRDGKELFYHMIASTPDSPPLTGVIPSGSLLSAMVSANGSVFEPGSPKDIVRSMVMNLPHTAPYQTYDISADGRRLLTSQMKFDAADAAEVATPSLPTGLAPESGVTIAINWPSSLKKN